MGREDPRPLLRIAALVSPLRDKPSGQKIRQRTPSRPSSGLPGYV